MKEKISNAFSEFWDKLAASAPDVLAAILVLTIFFALGRLFQSFYKNKLQKKWKSSIISKFVGQILYWVFNIVGVLIALNLLGFGNIVSSLLAGAGISAIIIGFAFKDIAENFLAGILLTIHRPFAIGDVIEIDNFKGPVRAVDMRTTHIRLADGRDIWIPNSMMVKGVLTNYTRDGLLRQEFIVGIDPYDDLERARDLIINLLKKEPEVLEMPEPNVLVEELGTSSVNIKVLFWIDVLKKHSLEGPIATGASIKSKMMYQIKDLLLNNGFNMPSYVIEHKMYKEKNPLKVMIENEKP